jgi:hypothetical protein
MRGIMLYNNRSQLAMDLSYFAKDDYELVNYIIHDYCNLINDKQFNHLEDVLNNKRQEL